jgi:hypothetical protein
MKPFVKIARKNEKGSNVTLKAVAIITDVDKEKLHHPELRPRIEEALKDFQLQLEEGEDVRLSRMMGLDVTFDELSDFEDNCTDVCTIINNLEIPAKEEAAIDEAKQVVESATDEEMEFVKSWLEDFKDDELLGVSYTAFWKNGFAPGSISGTLMKKLLTAFIQIYGQ